MGGELIPGMKMTLIALFAFVVLFIGCRSSNDTGSVNDSSQSTFGPAEPVSYDQIVSRRWIDEQGKVLQFLCASNLVFKGLPKLLVAQYGDTNARIVTCVDFYRPVELPGSYTGFIRLAHDIRPAKMMVTSINTVEMENRGVIMITRETIPEGMSQRKGLQYMWRYGKDLRMSLDLESRAWPILGK